MINERKDPVIRQEEFLAIFGLMSEGPMKEIERITNHLTEVEKIFIYDAYGLESGVLHLTPAELRLISYNAFPEEQATAYLESAIGKIRKRLDEEKVTRDKKDLVAAAHEEFRRHVGRTDGRDPIELLNSRAYPDEAKVIRALYGLEDGVKQTAMEAARNTETPIEKIPIINTRVVEKLRDK